MGFGGFGYLSGLLIYREYSSKIGKGKDGKKKKASRLKLGLLTTMIHAGSVPMGAYLILQVS